VDMQLTGQRHAFVAKYRAGCSRDGKLKFMDLKLYSNAGFSYDLSEPVMGRACLHCDSVYRWPALHVTGTLCRTNQSSHTAFRGFGGPQGVFACETVIEHLATAAKIPVDVVRKLNMYAVDDKTHFNTVLDEVNISDAWALVQDSCNYQKRIDEVEEFNRNNKWKKRGIYLMSMKYGINYTAKFMNQGGCLIHIYRDGSVIASHGGMEMGQGVS
jgi:xanthine dehydrogenase/oxidase